MATYDPTTTYQRRTFRNIPHQVRLKAIERKIRSVCKDRNVGSYLDLGCASGFITQRIKQILQVPEVVGTDYSDEYIDSASKNYPGIEFGKMNLNAPSKTGRTFDLVTCFETLEHVGSLDNAIGNIYDSLKAGGIGLISVPIETGPVGVVKYLLKSKLYGDKLNEINRENRSRYFSWLIRGQDISVFRLPHREIWWDHFGFNFRKIDELLTSRRISFASQSYFTTRFISIYKS